MSGEQIVMLAERAGFELREAPDGSVMVRPREIPMELREAISAHRIEVVQTLRLRDRTGREAVDRLAELRRFVPNLFGMVTHAHLGPVLLWSVSPHGVVVSPGPGRPLLIVEPKELSSAKTS